MEKSSDEERFGEYRWHLVHARERAQSDWDKTLVALAGGVLALSLVLLNSFREDQSVTRYWMLYAAWSSCGLSLISVLLSFVTSRNALTQAISEADNALTSSKEPPKSPGGSWACVTDILNYLGVISFILGVAMLSVFVLHT